MTKLQDIDKLRLPENGGKVSSFSLKTNYLFILSFLFGTILNFIKFPNYVFGGQMWAEMGTNYFPNSLSQDLNTKFFATDAGYIPFLTRWIAAAYSYLDAPSITIPYVYTFIAIFLSAILTSLFINPVFRPVIHSDKVRFLVCICVAVCADFETRTFVNFPYILSFYIIACLVLISKDGFETNFFLVLPILMVSKPLLMALIPVFFVIVAPWIKRRHSGAIILTTFVASFGIIQTLTLLNSSNLGVLEQNIRPTFFETLTSALGYFVGFLAKPVAILVNLTVAEHVILGSLFLFLLACFVKIFWQQRGSSVVIILASVFSFTLLNSGVMSDTFNTGFQLLANPTPVFRYTIPAIGGLFLLGGVVLDQIISSEQKQFQFRHGNNLIVFLSVLLVSNLGLKQVYEPISPTLYSSNWKEYSSAIDSDLAICVPVNPNGWTYGRGCSVIAQGVTWPVPEGLTKSSLKPFKKYPLKLESISGFDNLMAIGILVAPALNKSIKLSITVHAEFVNGMSEMMTETNEVNGTGSLVNVQFTSPLKIKDVAKISISFSSSIDLINQPLNPEVSLLATLYGN